MKSGKLNHHVEVTNSTNQDHQSHTFKASKIETLKKTKISSEGIENTDLSPSLKSPTSPTAGWETVQIKVQPADKGFSEIRDDIIQRRSKMSMAKESIDHSLDCLKHSLKETEKIPKNPKITTTEIKRSS